MSDTAASSAPTPLSEKDAPKTFLERGAAVPFTAASLMWARVRQNAHIKELLVPGLANTRGIYVFEWAGVPTRFTLTLHDRLLHRAIATEENPSPVVVASVANRIALSGAAGPDVQQAAERRVKEAADFAVLARLALTMRAIARLGGGTMLTLGELRTDAGQQRAKQVLAGVAGGFNIKPQIMHDRIEALSVLLADVGLAGMPVKAPARRLMQEMVQLTRVLTEWAEVGKGESVVEARLIARVAEETNRLAEQQTAIIDDNTQDFDQLLRDWISGERIMNAAVGRLAWILDGWDRLVNMWLDVADKPATEQSKTLALMSYLLPMVPIREVQPEDVEKWASFSKTLYGQARSSETPATGLIDFEMMLRLEGHRAREAS